MSEPSPEGLAAHMPGPVVRRHPSREAAEKHVAAEILALVADRPDAVLGLATGATMVGVYRALVAAARSSDVSFARVRTFNLDEYVGDLPRERTFRAFMDAELLDRLDFDPAHVFFPDAERAAADPLGACRAYEDAIAAAGGIDLQLLGIGRNGHVAFNEPPASVASRTRVVDLAPRTREDAASTFGGLDQVPERAITMGVATILEARALRILAFGAAKAEVVRAAVLGPVDESVPVTLVRERAVLDVDPEAGAQLA